MPNRETEAERRARLKDKEQKEARRKWEAGLPPSRDWAPARPGPHTGSFLGEFADEGKEGHFEWGSGFGKTPERPLPSHKPMGEGEVDAYTASTFLTEETRKPPTTSLNIVNKHGDVRVDARDVDYAKGTVRLDPMKGERTPMEFDGHWFITQNGKRHYILADVSTGMR